MLLIPVVELNDLMRAIMEDVIQIDGLVGDHELSHGEALLELSTRLAHRALAIAQAEDVRMVDSLTDVCDRLTEAGVEWGTK